MFRPFLIRFRKAYPCGIKIRFKKKGVVLLIVLGMLLVVTSLATVILSLILSHSRLTYHQTSRIQAYYAAQAGMNYALERLRTGVWTFIPNSCYPTSCLVTDPDFPSSVTQVRVIFCPVGVTCAPTVYGCSPPSGYSFCVNTTATYTYTP